MWAEQKTRTKILFSDETRTFVSAQYVLRPIQSEDSPDFDFWYHIAPEITTNTSSDHSRESFTNPTKVHTV